MKKVFSLLVAVVCVFLFAACGQEQPEQNNITTVELPPEPEPDVSSVPKTPQEAFPVTEETKIEISGVWEGYTELDFKEFFVKGITNIFATSDAVALESCEVSVVDGWENCEGFLDESSVAEGNSPVSYIAYLNLKEGETSFQRGYKFYMELTPEGILLAKGTETFESESKFGEAFDETETKAILEDLKESI